MTIALALLMLASPALSPAADRSCDAECEAVLTAAFDWSLEQVPSEDRRQTLFDVGQGRIGWGAEEPLETRAQTQFLRQLAVRKGVPALRKEDDPRFQRCRTEPDSRACRAHGGTTAFTLRFLKFVSADEATINVNFNTISVEGIASPAHFVTWELRLQRGGGTWRVADKRIIGQS